MVIGGSGRLVRALHDEARRGRRQRLRRGGGGVGGGNREVH